ncbi:MAG: ribosome biogenesis GTPase Der [Bacteroidia bacterium]|nr:ribosome biogenesis GTPase Der [Bacteroidia bacterium]MDW8157515.1 ribosome biogenesis GTPase Der [Bacteroidia bacterium]
MRGIVAIIGRPNVGKSTLFNRLIERRQAIVDDQPGVTRDRNYGICEWNGHKFTVIDTGGYIPEDNSSIPTAIREQVEIAIEEADALLFLVDVKEGLTFDDYSIVEVLRRKKAKNVFLVVNKVDNPARDFLAGEFYSLPHDYFFTISAINGSGTGDLLDQIVRVLPSTTEDDKDTEGQVPKISFVGRPNVGKSSLINALMGRTVNIVSDVPGTTRDAIYTRYRAFGFDYYLVDTAGLRKAKKVKDQIEFYAAIRTIRAIQHSDIVCLVIDATEGLQAQDLHILSLIERHKRGMIILYNKWDLVEKYPNIEKDYIDYTLKRIAPLSDIPILFISATEKIRIYKAMETVKQLFEKRQTLIPTHHLNEVLLPIVKQTPPPSVAGKSIKIKFITQVNASNPSFVFFTNHPKLIPNSYKRFLEKRIREHFGFEGWIISIYFRES